MRRLSLLSDLHESATSSQAPSLHGSRPLLAAEVTELSRKHRVSEQVVHLLALPQSGVVARGRAMSEPTATEFGGVNLELTPSSNPATSFFKSVFVPPRGHEQSTPYEFCEERARLLFLDRTKGTETDTLLRATPKVFLQHQSPYFYLYQTSPRMQVSVHPMTAFCNEGCKFCPVTYWKGSLTSKYNPVFGMEASRVPAAPEEIIASVVDDPFVQAYGGMANVEQIALATTRFGKPTNHGIALYEDYAIALGLAARARGFRGRMFLLSDRIRTVEQMAKVRRGLVEQGVSVYFVYTLEVAEDSLRRRIMPGSKSQLTRAEIFRILIDARRYFDDVGAFYVSGMEDVAVSLQVLDELLALGIKPGFNALNPLTVAIHSLLHERDIYRRLDSLLELQRHLAERAQRAALPLSYFVSENNNTLLPRSSRVSKDGWMDL